MIKQNRRNDSLDELSPHREEYIAARKVYKDKIMNKLKEQWQNLLFDINLIAGGNG